MRTARDAVRFTMSTDRARSFSAFCALQKHRQNNQYTTAPEIFDHERPRRLLRASTHSSGATSPAGRAYASWLYWTLVWLLPASRYARDAHLYSTHGIHIGATSLPVRALQLMPRGRTRCNPLRPCLMKLRLRRGYTQGDRDLELTTWRLWKESDPESLAPGVAVNEETPLASGLFSLYCTYGDGYEATISHDRSAWQTVNVIPTTGLALNIP
jgi:hypothetical protein